MLVRCVRQGNTHHPCEGAREGAGECVVCLNQSCLCYNQPVLMSVFVSHKHCLPLTYEQEDQTHILPAYTGQLVCCESPKPSGARVHSLAGGRE